MKKLFLTMFIALCGMAVFAEPLWDGDLSTVSLQAGKKLQDVSVKTEDGALLITGTSEGNSVTYIAVEIRFKPFVLGNQLISMDVSSDDSKTTNSFYVRLQNAKRQNVLSFQHQEVLASWLFAQYLLTNDVQIAYSQTEGYAPVTSRAQESKEYLDYLSRAGEDNDLYYRVKLDATRLLLENTERTFVTPVFNGSASLRNAAGHLIESVTKSMRRKETVDESYFETLYADTATLYKLDQKSIAERADLGELPAMSKTLLAVLGGTWVLIGLYVVTDLVKKRKK